MLSFGILAFWHDGQTPLVLASERGVLDGNGFEVTVGDIEGEGMSFSIAFYKRAGTRTDTTNLEVGIVVEVYEVGMSLGEAGEGSSSMELCL